VHYETLCGKLSTWAIILTEKLENKFLALYATGRFTIMPIRTHHWTLS